MQFTRDGTQLFTGSADRCITATDLASGKVNARMVDAHSSGITRLLFVSETAFASGMPPQTFSIPQLGYFYPRNGLSPLRPA